MNWDTIKDSATNILDRYGRMKEKSIFTFTIQNTGATGGKQEWAQTDSRGIWSKTAFIRKYFMYSCRYLYVVSYHCISHVFLLLFHWISMSLNISLIFIIIHEQTGEKTSLCVHSYVAQLNIRNRDWLW